MLNLGSAGRAAVAALTVAAAGCSATPGSAPESFVLEYQTGSIAPPYNYQYRIDGSVEGDAVEITYELEYRYRDQVTDAEMAALGYGPDDDLSWSTTLTGEEAVAWIELASAGDLETDPPDPPPGADAIQVTNDYADGTRRTGEPIDRETWELLADTLDARAREAIDHPREAP